MILNKPKTEREKLMAVVVAAKKIIAYRERNPDCITSLVVDSLVDQLAARCAEVEV